jgi:hypothetical protein
MGMARMLRWLFLALLLAGGDAIAACPGGGAVCRPIPAAAVGSPVFVSSVQALGAGLFSPTVTSAINTSGANFVVAVIASYTGGGGVNICNFSDSNGNTWSTALNVNPGGSYNWNLNVYYVYSPVVGTGHTFTCTPVSNGSYDFMAIAAFSGIASAPLDQLNSSTTLTGTSLGTGPVTTASAELVIAGAALGSGSTGGVAITLPFTLLQSAGNVSSTHVGGMLAYYIQPAAGTQSPTVSWTGSVTDGGLAGIATFK